MGSSFAPTVNAGEMPPERNDLPLKAQPGGVTQVAERAAVLRTRAREVFPSRLRTGVRTMGRLRRAW